MPTIDDVLGQIKEDYGDKIATTGDEVLDKARIPTGNFAFDLATGGGFPQGRISILYGPESSLKSTLLYLAIAQAQHMYPKDKAILVDTEASYDPKWGAKLGIDNSRFVRILPDYAEQAVDILEAFIYAEDVSLIGVDSLAAFIPSKEVESSADKASVGSAGLIVSKMYRKATRALSHAERDGRYPTLIFINQIRMKIGVMYGNPETMPGGNAPKFMSSLTVRLYGKDEMDKDVHATLPAWKLCTGVIKKNKVPVTSQSFEFRMATLPNSAKKLAVGQVDEWPIIESRLKAYGMLAKNGKKWELFGEEYPTLKALRQSVLEDYELTQHAKNKIIEAVLSEIE